jgi:hypothetical protein
VLDNVPPLSVIVAVEPQVLLLALTWKLVGAVAVMLPRRFEPVILKLVDDPARPVGVEGTVTVPPGTVIVGCKTVPDIATLIVLALMLAKPTRPE